MENKLLTTIGEEQPKITDDRPLTSTLINNAGYIKRLEVPSAATSSCLERGIAFDGSFIYICYADNSWVRAAVAAW